MLHVFISGQVQGVGFRRYVRDRAQDLNIKGWVKNLPDRRVEAVFQGDTKNIEKILDFCWKGPFLAEVSHIQKEELPDRNFEEFEIIR